MRKATVDGGTGGKLRTVGDLHRSRRHTIVFLLSKSQGEGPMSQSVYKLLYGDDSYHLEILGSDARQPGGWAQGALRAVARNTNRTDIERFWY